MFSLKCLLIIGGMQNTFLISQILKVDLSEDPIQTSKRAPVSTSHTFRREDKKFRTHPLPTLFGHKGRRGFPNIMMLFMTHVRINDDVDDDDDGDDEDNDDDCLIFFSSSFLIFFWRGVGVKIRA